MWWPWAAAEILGARGILGSDSEGAAFLCFYPSGEIGLCSHAACLCRIWYVSFQFVCLGFLMHSFFFFLSEHFLMHSVKFRDGFPFLARSCSISEGLVDWLSFDLVLFGLVATSVSFWMLLYHRNLAILL